MIPVADKFLIHEGVFNWARNSISNLLGRRALNKQVRPQLTANDKIENSDRIQRRLTPRPRRPERTILGFRGIRLYKRPVNLP